MSDQPKLDEWIDGERSVEVDVPDVTIEDGQLRSRGTTKVEKKIPERYRLTTPTAHRICSPDDHRYALNREPSGQLVAKCQKCKVGRLFVPGVHRLEDGRITEVRG